MNKTQTRYESIDQYIARFPANIQSILEELRRTIQETAPTAQEAIAYGIPTFRFKGNLVHFAAYQNHIGFYPGGPSAIVAFSKELSNYEQSKGTIRFPINDPIPIELVKKIVKFRVKENESKKKKRIRD